jgi:hypothetical protein
MENESLMVLATAIIAQVVTLFLAFQTLRADRQKFFYQTQEGNFADALQRAQGERQFARAGAVATLGEMAMIERGGEYPFFDRAAIQIATMLHTDTDSAVRNEIRRTVRAVAAQAYTKCRPNYELLLARIGDANKSAATWCVGGFTAYVHFAKAEGSPSQWEVFALEDQWLPLLEQLYERAVQVGRFEAHVARAKAGRWDGKDRAWAVKYALDVAGRLIDTARTIEGMLEIAPGYRHSPILDGCFYARTVEEGLALNRSNMFQTDSIALLAQTRLGAYPRSLAEPDEQEV